MKKKSFIALISLFALIFSSIFSTISFAGHNQTVLDNAKSTEDKSFNQVVEYNNVNTQRTNINSKTIILINSTEINNVNWENVKSTISNSGATVFLEYSTFENLLTKEDEINVDLSSLQEIFENNYDYISKFNKNGYISLALENNDLVFGGFFTTSKDENNILNNYNIYKGYIQPTADEGTEKVTETLQSRASQGNYDLYFYWNSNTDYNKIYSIPNASSQYIAVSLYYGEMLQDLGTLHERSYTANGYQYTETFRKVQANTSGGSLVTGYFLKYSTGYNPTTGDGFGGNDEFGTRCKTLPNLIQSAYNNNTNLARTDGHMFYRNGMYGIKIKKNTAIYNSSGGKIKDISAGSVVWVNETTRCGYSHPEYMTINGWSSSSTGTIETYSSTTFVDAGLLIAHPKDYKIDTRWW